MLLLSCVLSRPSLIDINRLCRVGYAYFTFCGLMLVPGCGVKVLEFGCPTFLASPILGFWSVVEGRQGCRHPV